MDLGVDPAPIEVRGYNKKNQLFEAAGKDTGGKEVGRPKKKTATKALKNGREELNGEEGFGCRETACVTQMQDAVED